MAQYLKPDTELGYIEDVAEIEYSKINNLRHTVLGCMLGDFDETGAYVVAPEIVKELIEMEKYVVDTYDNIEICKSFLKLDKQISFMVVFEGNKATLSLVEKLSYEANFKINSGTYSNINEYVLDSVETSGEINHNTIYQRWHINPYGGNVVDIFNCDEAVLEKYFGIVNRFKYLLNANKILLEKEIEIEEVESSYTNEMLEIITRYPKLYKEVLKTVSEIVEKKQDTLVVTKPNFAKTFNEVLENAIKQNINVLNEKEKESFYAEKRNAVVNLNLKREAVIETEHVKQDNELNPNIITFKSNTNYESLSLDELGKGFVSAHKNFNQQVKDEKTENTEKGKLVKTLVATGLGEKIGVKPDVEEMVKEETVAEKPAEVKAVKAAPKKAEEKKAAPKKAEAKKPAGKKPAVKKPANKPKDIKKEEKTEETIDAKKELQKRLFSLMTSDLEFKPTAQTENKKKIRRGEIVEVGREYEEVKKEDLSKPIRNDEKRILDAKLNETVIKQEVNIPHIQPFEEKMEKELNEENLILP